MRILVLSSNDKTVETFKELENLGYMISSCGSVMAASALVEEFNPRAVFVEVSVRGARDFVLWLRKETGCSVFAITDKETEEQLPNTGLEGHIRSPISEESITDILQSAGIGIKNAEGNDYEDSDFWDITRDIRKTFEEIENYDDYEDSQTQQHDLQDVRVISQEVVSIWGAKGGAGRTTLAVNLSRLLSDFDVLLIDLNFVEGPGDINALLDLPASPHVGSLLNEKNDRRKGFMESLIKPKKGSFAIIQPPPTIDQAEQICPDDIIELVDQARRCFQIVIIDLPPDISPVTLEAIDLSTVVLFVSDSHIGSLARVESIKAFVRKDITKSLILNKFNSGSRKAKEIAYFLDIPLAALITTAQITKDIGISDYISKHCDSIITQGVAQIVENVFGIKSANAEKKSRWRGLVKGAISNLVG